MMRRNLTIPKDANASGDEELIQRAGEGQLDAFNALYERYLPKVYSRVNYVVPTQDVEDVVQEIFIAVMKSLKSFKGNAQFGTWLYTLTNRRIADYYRRRGSPNIELDLNFSETDYIPVPELNQTEHLPGNDEAIMLRQAIRALPEHYQEVIRLRFSEGLPFAEIALLNGMSLEATKSLFRRAIATLRSQMGDSNG
jgi:RNA polymerase sigma-70 factor (ECF subfamily)